MGNLYSKGTPHDMLDRQFDQGMTLPKLLQEKDRIVDSMRKHIAEKSCQKRKSEYLYQLSHRDFSDWMAVMKDPCEKQYRAQARANELNRQFLDVYSCIKKLSKEQHSIVLIAI